MSKPSSTSSVLGTRSKSPYPAYEIAHEGSRYVVYYVKVNDRTCNKVRNELHSFGSEQEAERYVRIHANVPTGGRK